MKFKFIKPVYAHCDIPCGIYETETMKVSAATCLRMIEKIEKLGDVMASNESHNNFIRMVTNKENQAQLCKEQLYTLWSDFFKPEHLTKIPDLHDKFWKAAKQCSKVKQTLSKEECQKLVDMVNEIAKLYKQSIS